MSSIRQVARLSPSAQQMPVSFWQSLPEASLVSTHWLLLHMKWVHSLLVEPQSTRSTHATQVFVLESQTGRFGVPAQWSFVTHSTHDPRPSQTGFSGVVQLKTQVFVSRHASQPSSLQWPFLVHWTQRLLAVQTGLASGQVLGVSPRQHSPTSHSPLQQRLPFSAAVHSAAVVQGMHRPLLVQIGAVGSVQSVAVWQATHWPASEQMRSPGSHALHGHCAFVQHSAPRSQSPPQQTPLCCPIVQPVPGS